MRAFATYAQAVLFAVIVMGHFGFKPANPDIAVVCIGIIAILFSLATAVSALEERT